MDAIDRAFHEESAFIARCTDVGTLLDRVADYRDDGRQAVKKGLTKARLRAEDLIELAQARVVTLKAERLRAKAERTEGRAEPSRPSPTAPRPVVRREAFEPPAPSRSWLATPDVPRPAARSGPSAGRQLPASSAGRPLPPATKASAPSAGTPISARSTTSPTVPTARGASAPLLAGRPVPTATKALAPSQQQPDPAGERLVRLETELAAARAAERQAKAGQAAAEERHQRALEQAARERGKEAPTEADPSTLNAPTVVPGSTRATTRNREPSGDGAGTSVPAVAPVQAPAVPEAPLPMPVPATLPLVAAPTPLDEDPLFADLFARPVQAAPVEAPAASVVYTGSDLARYRAEMGLTQRLAAAQFGVAHGTIAKAEMEPAKVLGEILQAGMRNVRGK